MHGTGTKKVSETTIYRILGGGQAQVIECLLRDTFTRTLLAMVLATNLLIIFIPASVRAFDIESAKTICHIISLSLLPGYAVLMYLLISRVNRAATISQQLSGMDKGQLTLSQAPRLRNAIIGIQCLLFASLLCSTFIMRQQLGTLHADPAEKTELHLTKEPTSQRPGTSLLPLLRQYISL